MFALPRQAFRLLGIWEQSPKNTVVLIYWKFWTSRLHLTLSLCFPCEIWQWCHAQPAKQWLSAWISMKKAEQLNWGRISMLSVWPQVLLTIWWPFMNLLWIYWFECVWNSESAPRVILVSLRLYSWISVRASWLPKPCGKAFMTLQPAYTEWWCIWNVSFHFNVKLNIADL